MDGILNGYSHRLIYLSTLWPKRSSQNGSQQVRGGCHQLLTTNLVQNANAQGATTKVEFIGARKNKMPFGVIIGPKGNTDCLPVMSVKYIVNQHPPFPC